MSEEDKDEIIGEGADANPSPKRKKKKLVIAGAVVGAVVVLGTGLWVWHEQPEFCSAICHTPMDAYGMTYLEGDVDKWGNGLTETEAMAMMSLNHKAKADARCMSCHQPVLSQQVGEALHWVTGDYEVVGENSLGQLLLEERSLDELASAWGADGDGFCLRAGCHAGDDGSAMTREGLAAKTAGLSEQFNPHREQHGEVACGECHKGHSQSVNYCTQCHAEAPVPDGWLTYSEAKKKAAA